MQNRESHIFSYSFKRNVPSSVILNKLDWMAILNRCDYLLSVLIYKLLNNCNDINNCLMLGPFCYKLITIVNCYLKLVYPILFSDPKASNMLIVIELLLL